jgi:hypothetical protein
MLFGLRTLISNLRFSLPATGIAMGVYDTLKEKGFRILGDISVVGF